MINFDSIKKISILAIAILAILLPAQVFSQSTSLSGTVQDASKGYLPGVTITAKNIDTGVETVSLTNDSGAFNFASIQPGKYEVSAELDGFQKSTKTDVELGGSQQSRMNFELQVAGFENLIEVTTTAQDILTESSSSTGTVLRSQTLIDLPLTSNDVMDLVNIMGGVQPSTGTESEFDSNRTDQSFAGVNANSIHIQQDGITINDVRYNTGIASSSRINTEMVSEFKLILSPVDAEMGRGMGQVQILTKSGANAYHGSGVWNINNTALDANSWSNNRLDIPLEWRNLNTYTLSLSGPIKKNKTFFFLTWDHAIPRTHTNMAPQVLTNCARKGIFRYFTNWSGARSDADITGFNRDADGNITTPTAGAIQGRPVVDPNGIPLDVRFADLVTGLEPGRLEIITEAPTSTPENFVASSLQFENVFGPLTKEARALVEQDLINCSAYDPYGNGYDMDNPTSDTSLAALGITRYWEAGVSGTGVVHRILDTQAIPNFTNVMPEANNWSRNPTGTSGSVDGLNFATHTWTRADKGVDRIYGVGSENARKNITVKLDHNFNDRHRISGTYTYERDVNTGATKLWPDGYAGTTERFPQRFSITVTSSLRPTLLNEARFGLNRNLSHSLNAIDATATKDEVAALMQSMLPTETWQNFPNDKPMFFNPQRFWTNNYQSHFIGGSPQSWVWHSFLPSWGGYDHRWTMSDTLTWTMGRHSLKFGGDIRLTRSHQDADGDAGLLLSRPTMPVAFGGIQQYSLPSDLKSSATNFQVPGLTGSNFFWNFAGTYLNLTGGSLQQMQELRDYSAGSMSHVWQWFFIQDPFDKDWNDISLGEINRIVDIRHKEMAFFAKDDWKVNNSLTLNLGLRYEYYGVPYLDRGMSLALQGGANGLFGVTGRDFSTWMAERPINLQTTLTAEQIANGESYLTVQEFVGPGSPQPDVSVFEKDLNNFGPAIGFAWQLPWFGKGKTTVRGGYQLSYSQIANADNINGGFADLLAGSTGTNFDFYYYGTQAENSYMRFADLDSYLPTRRFLETPENPILPLKTLDIKNRAADLSVYDQNIRNPYTQSLNFSVSRNIGSNVTVDVRYIGTLARKGVSNLNLNSANWLNNGLKEAFDAARAGGTTPLLDQFFQGLNFNITNTGVVGTPGGPTGGDVLRDLGDTEVALSQGNYNALAGTLNRLNYQRSAGGFSWDCFCTLPRLNYDLPAPAQLEVGTVMRHANSLYPGLYPENFIVANPQLGAANWYTNLDHNNYHSMQVRMEVRPTHGFNITNTYTWSKNLGNGGTYTNPNDRTNPFDYTWTGNSRAHQLNSYGAFELPFGANGFFFRDISNPIVRRVIEGWNLSWILSLNSGSRGNITADGTQLYGNAVPNIIRPDLFDPESGHVYWEPGARNGYYWGDPNQYSFGPDLQCFDENLVKYAYSNVQVATGVLQQVETTALSLRDNCITNLSALYVPMTEMVTEWYQPAVGTPEYANRNSFGYVSREVEKPVYSPENVIFQNAMPGEYGSFGRNRIEGPGSFSLDMAMGKTVQLTEGKSMQIRVDAGNILNHPSPGGGVNSISVNNNEFGLISNKSGQRRFQAKITLRF